MPASEQVHGRRIQQWIRSRVAGDEAMRKAAEQRTAEPSGDEDEDSSTDVVMVLTREHNKVRALLKQVAAIPGHKHGGTAQDRSQRKSIVDMITVRLSRHEAAEQELLWPAVRKAVPDGDQLADGALAQEQEGSETLTALGKLGPDTEEFDALVEQLDAQCRKHVAYEYQVFLRLSEAMPDSEREELGRRIARAHKRAPARPRKRAPGRPAAAVKAAGAAAAADEVRDAATDRPARRKDRPAPESQDQDQA